MLVIGGPAGCESPSGWLSGATGSPCGERSGQLGGQLNLAAVCPRQGEFRTLLNYYTAQLAALGVEVCLNREATPVRPGRRFWAGGGGQRRPAQPGTALGCRHRRGTF